MINVKARLLIEPRACPGVLLVSRACPNAGRRRISQANRKLSVRGTTVYDPQGSNIGSIKRLMIEKISGRVAYAVMFRAGLHAGQLCCQGHRGACTARAQRRAGHDPPGTSAPPRSAASRISAAGIPVEGRPIYARLNPQSCLLPGRQGRRRSAL
jgi:hypothetical protein